MKLEEYTDRDRLIFDLADQLASDLRSALSNHDSASFAVPGGTTPGPIFDILSAVHLDWDRVHVMLTDERWVPENHERSNTRLVKDRLLTGPAQAARYVPLYSGHETPEEGIEGMLDVIEAELPLSVLLLGMGDDMHTASLFPGADRLDDALAPHAPYLMAMRAPGAPEPRITLTRPVLSGAMSTHIVITGATKREALERARKIGDPKQAPICAVLNDATVHWSE